MKTGTSDSTVILGALDELSQTVEAMGNVISRLQQHVENLTQQREALLEDITIVNVPPKGPFLH